MRIMMFKTEPFRVRVSSHGVQNEKRKSSRLNKHLRFPSAQVKATVNLHTPEFEEFEHVSM